MSAGRCTFCGDTVDPKQDYRRVEGWERARAAGGTNAVRLRRPTDVWACRFCVDKEARGVGAAQTGLM